MEACFRCCDIALKIRPLQTIATLIKYYKLGKEKKKRIVDDPDFLADFDEAYDVQENGDPQRFAAKSNVLTAEIYGFELFQDYAALTDGEYAALIGSTAQELKKKPFQVPFQTPEALKNYHLLDLPKLTQGVSDGMRKARVYFRSEACHQKVYLDGSKQMLESKGVATFHSTVAGAIASRSLELRPTAKG